jgi:hypothetical protein
MTTVVRLSQPPAPTEVRLQIVDETVEVVSATPTIVRIIGVEQAGPMGLQGDQGELGPTGLSAYEVALLEGFVGTEELWLESLVGPQGLPGGSYRHVQNATASSWVIVHSLGYEPNVAVFDSGGTQVIGDITHNSVNQLTVTFSSAFSGVAYLS